MMWQHVGIVGATGAVGREFRKILEQRDFPHEKITFLASSRSAGKMLTFKGRKYTIQELTESSFGGMALALFSAGGGVSKQFAPLAAEAGCIVVDNSSAFRMDADTPLVVPEVNPAHLAGHKGIVANPNCSTIIMIVPVAPLYRANRVERLVVNTYQAASGAGHQAMLELADQSRALAEGKQVTPKAFPHQIAFNLFCHDSAIGPNGYNTEEMKMVNETRKMLADDRIQIAATCVRVPVMRAHSESINLRFEKPITESEVREILSAAPGVRVVDDREANYFPMPIDASDGDDILVGRIRQDISQPDGRGIEMFVSGDQLRKGAALNAVQIAEALAERPSGAGGA